MHQTLSTETYALHTEAPQVVTVYFSLHERSVRRAQARSIMAHYPGSMWPGCRFSRRTSKQGEAPAGMAAGASFGDEGQGREGEVLDTSCMSNDGTRLAVPASLVNVHRMDRARESAPHRHTPDVSHQHQTRASRQRRD